MKNILNIKKVLLPSPLRGDLDGEFFSIGVTQPFTPSLSFAGILFTLASFTGVVVSTFSEVRGLLEMVEDTLPVVGRIDAFIIPLTGEGLTSALTGNACVNLAGGDKVFGGRRIFWSGLATGEGALTNPLNEVGTKFFS